MKKLHKSMKFLTVIFLTIFFFADLVSAQDRIPREYSNPDELISFDRRTSFPEAIDVLNVFAQEHAGKFIIDRTGYTGEIRVSLPAMNWRDALDYILRVQNFVALESPDVFELVTRAQADQMAAEPERPDGERPRTTPSQDELAMRINTSTREVRINATFFEGSRRALREIGVDWSTLTNMTPGNIADFVGEGGSQTIPATEFDGSFVNVNSRGAQNVSQNVFNSLINFGDVGGIEVQALFSAFEADNLGKILATPSIKVMNGEQGRIQVGQDFSIKQRDFAGNVTDQFFSTGTILTVTPQIVEVGDTTLIYLDIEAERSSAQPDPVSTIVSRQQANTHAILLDGESTVMAGLYRTEEARVRRGVPFLKDLPGWFFGLKYLFGYNSTDVQEDELIVLLQAELEKPIAQRVRQPNRSQNDLLTNAQALHRERMDRVVERPDMSLETSFIETADGPSEEPEEVIEAPEEPAEPEPVAEPELSEAEIEARRAELERRQLQEARLQQEDITRYAGEWRPMQLTNLNGQNGEFDHLNFYIIGGSFQVRENADRLYRNFRQEGLPAHMLYNESTGFYFVAYRGFETVEDARPYLRNIQQNRQSEAWLSRIIRETRLDLNNNSR